MDNVVTQKLDDSEWNLIEEQCANQAQPPEISTREWADEHRYIARSASAYPGKFDAMRTPYMIGIYHLIDDPAVKVLVSQKSAQIAWTETINNVIGKRVHHDPCNMIIMFAKEKAGKNYEREKFVPMVKATPVLNERINTSRSKASGNTWDHKNFPNGFIKFITSNSSSDVKSTAAPLLIVEEPDDANANVKGQGNTLKLLQERGKTFANRMLIFGGTPTVKNFSNVEAGYLLGDQRVYLVRCHECGDFHELNFDYLLCREYDDGYIHPIYGKQNPETSYYACPHCGVEWSDEQKNRNVRDSVEYHEYGWEPTQGFSGVASVRFNELLSPFPGSRFVDLKKKELEALHEKSKGNEEDWIVFTNNSMGIAYEYGGANIDEETLKEKALDYKEKEIPEEGLVLTAGVDVQHDRLAVVIRAWGRDEKSWLIYWGELHGTPSQITDPVWASLEKLLWTPIPHASGFNLTVRATSIDTSDGQTNDAVYKWVKKHSRKKVLPIKGSNNYDAPIYKVPPKTRKVYRTKAENYGLTVYMVGTQKAKDLIIGSDDGTGRIRLSGNQYGVMNWYVGVRADYYEQLLSEVKAPHHQLKGRLVWQKKAGVNNEGLDCEVYALHSSRYLKIHLWSDKRWDQEELQLRQTDLLSAAPVSRQENAKSTGFKEVKHEAW